MKAEKVIMFICEDAWIQLDVGLYMVCLMDQRQLYEPEFHVMDM